MTDIKKSYWSVIPAEVRYSEKLPGDAKLLYSEITALCNDKGFCWANNDYFSKLYKVENRTIQRWLNGLAKENFIYVDTTGKRKIFICNKFNPKENYEENIPEEVSEEKPVVKKAKVKKVVKQIKKVNEQDLFLAELLLSKIIYNFPLYENKKVNISNWADDIRQLREIENATVDQISFMINWLHGGEVKGKNGAIKKMPANEFWSKNILSTAKLRKQWFNLIPQMQSSIKKVVDKSDVAQL